MAVQRRSHPIGPSQNSSGVIGRSFLVAFLYRLLLVVAAFALLLPFFGPMLDHHVAERHPYHAHIYFSPFGTEHVHFYEDIDYHVHLHQASDHDPQTSPRSYYSNSGVVFLTSNDGLAQSATSLVVTALHIDVDYPDPDGNPFLLRFGEEDSLPPGAFVPPPRKPPPV